MLIIDLKYCLHSEHLTTTTTCTTTCSSNTGKWWLRLEFLFDSNVCLISPTEIRNANITHMRGAPRRETIENNNQPGSLTTRGQVTVALLAWFKFLTFQWFYGSCCCWNHAKVLYYCGSSGYWYLGPLTYFSHIILQCCCSQRYRLTSHPTHCLYQRKICKHCTAAAGRGIFQLT